MSKLIKVDQKNRIWNPLLPRQLWACWAKGGDKNQVSCRGWGVSQRWARRGWREWKLAEDSVPPTWTVPGEVSRVSVLWGKEYVKIHSGCLSPNPRVLAV